MEIRGEPVRLESVKAMFDQFIWELKVDKVLALIATKTGQNWVRHEKVPTAYRVVWRYLRWHLFRGKGEKANRNIDSYSAEQR